MGQGRFVRFCLGPYSRLVNASVDADLHVLEGMFNGFFYNPDVPESRDWYDGIVKFFGRQIGYRTWKKPTPSVAAGIAPCC